LIFKAINTRLKKLFINKLSINTNNKIVSQKTDETNIEPKKYFVIPYIRNISEITTSLINKSVFTVGFRCLKKIVNFVKIHKHKTEQAYKNNVVYKILRQDCDVSYMGQTKRQLKSRD